MLEKLNQKPESYRRKVALFATCLAGLFIVTVWVVITQEKMSRTLDGLFPQNKESALSEEDANFEKVLEKAKVSTSGFRTHLQRYIWYSNLPGANHAGCNAACRL